MGGFGGGVRDDKTRQHFVNALEAHSGVEVFFPGNGWIPFEPTPDGTNSPINLPLTPAALNAAANAPGNDASLSIPRQLKEPAGAPLSGITAGSFSDIWRPALIVAGGLPLLLAIPLLVALRWLLSPRDVPRTRRRLRLPGGRLRGSRQPGETPRRFRRRAA